MKGNSPTLKMISQSNEATGLLCSTRWLPPCSCLFSADFTDTTSPAQQWSAQLKDIHQRARDAQPLGVFCDAAIARLGKTKEAL